MTEEWGQPNADEWDEISKSQVKRDALEVTKLGENLVTMTKKQLSHIPLEESILEIVMRARAMPASSARRREIQYLGKHLRATDYQSIQTAYDELMNPAIVVPKTKASKEATWLDALLSDEKATLGKLMEDYPSVDLQRIRNWLRQLRKEKNDDKKAKIASSVKIYLNQLLK